MRSSATSVNTLTFIFLASDAVGLPSPLCTVQIYLLTCILKIGTPVLPALRNIRVCLKTCSIVSGAVLIGKLSRAFPLMCSMCHLSVSGFRYSMSVF